jgi:hypothetical protein
MLAGHALKVETDSGAERETRVQSGTPCIFSHTGLGTPRSLMIEERFLPLEMRSMELDAVASVWRVQRRLRSSLRDRLQFGGPAVTPISSAYHPEDADLQAFIVGSNERCERWLLIQLAISFAPSEGPPLETATVHVNLSDDGEPSKTVAFSLLPLTSGTPYDETSTYTVSPSVNAGGLDISLGSAGKSIVHHGSQTFLVGGPEISATPTWTFMRTATQQLVGSWRLSMTVRAPQGRTGKISVDLEAKVAKRLGWTFKKKRIPLPVGDPTDSHGEVTF